MKKWIASIVCSILIVAGVAFSSYFPDVIVTSPNGVWTDTRAYATINAAITAIGANVRDIYVVRQEITTTLTIPANAHLNFFGSGSIANSAQLTINTTNIKAGNRQIFTGAGDIDFIAGSIVRSSWFSDLDETLDVTNDDTLTLVITEAETLTANCAVGNAVTLRWESPFIISTGAFTMSNIKNIEAGNYQIFAGAGDFDFLAGSVLKSSWFVRLRTAVEFTTDENVNLTILVDQPETIDANTTLDAYQTLEVKNGCLITVNAGQTLTINGGINAGSYQIFGTTGDLDFAIGSVLRTSWFSTLILADTFTDDDNVSLTLLVDQPETIGANTTLDEYQTLEVPVGNLITISSGFALTLNGHFKAGRYQTFSHDNTDGVALGAGAVGEVYPEWWGENTTPNTTDMTAEIQTAIDTVEAMIDNQRALVSLEGQYKTSAELTVEASSVTIKGSSFRNTWITSNHATANVIKLGDGSNSYWNIVLRDLILSKSVVATAGYAISIDKCSRVLIDNVEVYGDSKVYDGFYLYRSYDVNLTNTTWVHDVVNRGVNILGDSGTESSEHRISSWIMSNGEDAIYIGVYSQGIYIDPTNIYGNTGVGINIQGTAADIVENIFIWNAIVDTCGEHGIYIEYARRVIIEGTWVSSVGNTGIAIQEHAERIKIHGGNVLISKNSGITVDGDDVSVDGVSITSAGYSNVNAYDAIYVGSNAVDALITNNYINDYYTDTRYGINVDGAATDITISNNRVGSAMQTDYFNVGSNATMRNNEPSKETFTIAAPTLQPWETTEIDSNSNAVNGTLDSGQYIGQIKTIVMTEASNPSTISITNHQTSDPEIATFNAVDETGIFMWTGTEWITMFATCTF